MITGLSEDPDEIGANDSEKVIKVLQSAGYADAVEPTRWEMRRLGQANERRKRPLLIKVESQPRRDAFLRVARNLKDAQGPLSSVYMKMDMHPAVRKEYARLRKREQEEGEKSTNVGATITYDRRNRVLVRDGVIIDKYSP